MQTKAKDYPNGWAVTFEKGTALYSVIVRNARGDVHDKVRCDTRADANAYWRAFCAIARNA